MEPNPTVAGFGVIAIDVSVLTVNVAVPFTPLFDAVIVEVPFATPVARPAVEIVATLGVPELQVT